MTPIIRLANRTYTVAPDCTGALLVLRQQSPTLWRVASEPMRAKVLRGLGVPVLRQATNNGEIT